MRRTPILLLLAASIAWPVAASAQDAADDLEGIDAIVVTITKRAESLTDVAATISAFDSATIDQVDIQSVSDVVNLIPNAQIKGDGNESVAIRGVSQSFTSQAPVAMHLNGIWRFASRTSFSGTFYDLGSIQVQRGPVGTVYGRNATAGAMDVHWKKPHSSYEVEGDVTVGNHSLYMARGVVNIPLLGEDDERLMARFAFQRETRDNYADLLNRKSHDGGVDRWYFRGSLRSVLSEDLEITIRGSFARDRESEAPQAKPITVNGQQFVGRFPSSGLCPCGSDIFPRFDPLNGYQLFVQDLIAGSLGAPVPALGGLSVIGFNQIIGGFSSLEESTQDIIVNGVAAFGIPPFMPLANFGLPLLSSDGQTSSNSDLDLADNGSRISLFDMEVLWSLNDLPLLGDIQVKALGGWDRWRILQVPEADGTDLAILDNVSFQRRKTWVGEINVVSQNDSPLSWIAGFFYFDSEWSTETGTITPFSVLPLSFTSEDRTAKGYAPFAQVGLRPLEALSDDPMLDFELWAGIRYNHDETTIAASNATFVAGGDASTFREVTYEFGVRYFPIDDHMVYAKWTKGYKPGFQEVPFDRGTVSGFEGFLSNKVEPEIIRAWEFGWKGSFWDNRIQSALTYFTYSYTDLQIPKILAGVVVTSNAGAATNQGIELELRIQPTEEWSIQFVAGWLDATFDEFCLDDELNFQDGDLSDPGCEIGGTPGQAVAGPGGVPAATLDFNRNFNLAGNDLEDSPNFKLTLLSAYQIDLGEMGTLTPSVLFSWTDDYFRRPFNRKDVDLVDSRTRTDLRLVWKSVDARYGVEFFVQNLEDETVYARTIAIEVPVAAVGFGLLPPRVFGVRFRYHWGGE